MELGGIVVTMARAASGISSAEGYDQRGSNKRGEYEAMGEDAPRHFVGYHNVDVQNGHLSGDGGRFETNKSILPEKGDLLWCFEGERKPRRYRLITRGVVSHSTRHSGAPSQVHYKPSVSFGALDATDLPWFRKLVSDQSSFRFGLNVIRDPETVAELERYVERNSVKGSHFTNICAYTLKHSADLETYADGREHTILTGGKSWARIAQLLAKCKTGEIVPVLFAPAENFIYVTACAELLSVKTRKIDGINSFAFKNFRYLSPPLKRSSLKWHDGHPLGNFRREYAPCLTPKGLAERCIVALGTEIEDVAAVERDPTIPDKTTRKALIEARRGQGKFRRDVDERWDDACAVTGCKIRDLLRASHIKPWRLSGNSERLDAQNGILLSANIDILFDKGFLSFDDRGRMLISERIAAADRRLLGLPRNLRRKPDVGERSYLGHHRKAFRFRGA